MVIYVTPQVYADAGEDQTLLGENSTTLQGNDPSPGTGTWTLISGPNVPLIHNPNDPHSTVSGLIHGTYIFRWTIDNTPCPGDYDDVVITVIDVADLAITKTISDDNPVAGSTVSYHLVVENLGPSTAQDVVVTDHLPGEVTLIDVIPTKGSWTAPLWTIGSMEAGATETLTLIVMINEVPDGTLIINTASVDSSTTDPDLSNNTDSAEALVQAAPEISLDKTIASGSPYSHVGDIIVYHFTITNTGNVPLAGPFTVTDDKIGVLENCAFGPLMPGESVVCTGEYVITQADIDNGLVTNEAYAETVYAGEDIISNTDTATAIANQQPELVISKTVKPDGYVSPGTMLQYNIVVENTGNISLTNIIVTDELPEYTSFLSTNGGGVYDEVSNEVTWTVGMLAPGESIALTLYVMIDDDVPHEWIIANTATADSDQTDPVESDPAEVIVIRPVMLQLVSVTHVLCHGEHTGSATVEAIGGLPPYTFTWYTQPVQIGETAYDLPAGTYVVVVVDALGNTAQLSVTITQPDAPLDAIASVTDILCNGAATGAIHVEVFDGTPPYTFKWNNGATTQNLEDVIAGIYRLEITDENGCVFTIQEEIKEPPALLLMDIMIEDVLCKEDSLGSIYFTVTGGVPPYEYLWNNGRTTRILKNMPGGMYEVTITDANNCVHVYEFEIGYQYEDCEIRVPEGLSMNQSGFNDIWIINGLQRYPNNKVQVFNRWGTLVYEASPYQNDWDGTPNRGRILTESDGKLPAGTYYWLIQLDPNLEPLSGFIYLGR